MSDERFYISVSYIPNKPGESVYSMRTDTFKTVNREYLSTFFSFIIRKSVSYQDPGEF